ncbi:MAG: PQQ-like beta-propeller repeat protein [Bacteroidaceae bacterium]|nr:PQQ-like beta-propeller repeat protein [Bacteroidaceae bacterium]
MKPSFLLFLAVFALSACKPSTPGSEGKADGDVTIDSAEAATTALTTFPDTAYASVDRLQFVVEILDTATDATLSDLADRYANVPGNLTFRGGPLRNEPTAGSVSGTPTKIVRDWTFHTGRDDTPTSVGSFGGGSGWTGQPVYIRWTDEQVASQRASASGLTADFGAEEIIVGSLCGKVYCINFANGLASREALDAGNPIKGSVSLDPSLSGGLYAGQGIPAHPPIGQVAFNLFSHARTFFYGPDPKAERHWGAFDSSPVAVGQFLFWPGENGTIYKYARAGDGNLKIHTKLRYHVRGMPAAGVENSLCAYRNYGWFGDNHGNIVCVNLNTMRPVWHYDNHDDIDGSIVCEVDSATGTPYLYTACEVDRQGAQGICHFVKLNGLTGELVWEQQFPCLQLHLGGKHFDGGLYCTPLLGHGDCEGLLFASICQPGTSHHADFVCLRRTTGEVVYRKPLEFFAWSSPVPFYNAEGQLFIVTGDSAGRLYLFRAATGELLFKEVLGNNFESTPVPIGNALVVGSRGQEIHKFHLE